MPCNTYVKQNVCVNAQVRVTPLVTVGEVQTFCKQKPSIGERPGIVPEYCSFHVNQSMCIQIPLTFDAEVTAQPNGIVCEEATAPNKDVCEEPPSHDGVKKECTLSKDQFEKKEDLTNALITAAGGFIVLGSLNANREPVGYSYVVTIFNAKDVFEGALPYPPFQEYIQLYQQLLTAKLNVQNGATCAFAEDAIADADALLSSEIPTLPTEILNRLKIYNHGIAPNCPQKCTYGKNS